MRFKIIITLSVSFLLFLLFSTEIQATDYFVKSKADYKKIYKKLSAGDNVVLANGTWQDFEIVFMGEGTQDKPITLSAETKGKVFLTGSSNLRLAGEYLVVSGLVFKDGYSPTAEVISFRRNKSHLANHSRVTEVVIDNYSNPDKFDQDKWVVMYGKHNRFDHSYLAGKRNAGVTMAVRLNTEDSQENYHRIDHNYFGPRPILGSNGGETLRIGTSHYSLSNSFTTIENNYFDRCDGEVEIISNKSGQNKIINNVFYESRGTLTLRHGNGNLVEGNVFFGNGKDHTGGIRVINADQTIRHNYMEGLTGYRFGSGFTVMNGVPNSPINRYHQVKNANISNNSLFNVDHIQLAAGSDAERSAAPIDSLFSANLISHDKQIDGFTTFDDVRGITFKDNVLADGTKSSIGAGFINKSFELERADNGLLYPKDGKLAEYGIKRDIKVIQKSQTGPDWYPKAEPTVAFDSGAEIRVTPQEDILFNTIKTAKSGDVIYLEPGEYTVRKTLSLDKVLTFKGQSGLVKLTFLRKTLFNIEDKGSLRIDGLIIDAKDAPDSAGNVLIANTRLPTIYNYRLEILNTSVQNLNVNHSFHVFDSGYRAFADHIVIKNSVFNNITGDILRLNKELDDLGIYNAEYVTLRNNKFIDVQGTLINLYRGGTDESTFGPHFVMLNNELNNVGNGKRNKSKVVATIHGAQVTNIENNSFEQTPDLIINHTVGEPQTKVLANHFAEATKLHIVEMNVDGPHTAKIQGNNNLTVVDPKQ
ncbi:MAG: alginate lyase [Gammaproteobacteria bacterium]|nr:alginate lyase [Gammaproteobacteria bacterium]